MKLFGEGNYAITDIQEVNVSEQFLGLDTATRGCTRNSELEGCETKTYLEKAKDKCGCIPNNVMRFFPEENVSSFHSGRDFECLDLKVNVRRGAVPVKISGVWEGSR